MMTRLARAAVEPSTQNITLVLAAAGVAAGVAIAAAVPIITANRRRHRQREGVVALTVLWGLLSAGLIVWAINRDWSAAAEQQRQIMSGDYDPRDLPTPPASLWPAWVGLAAAYIGLVTWGYFGRARVVQAATPHGGIPVNLQAADTARGHLKAGGG